MNEGELHPRLNLDRGGHTRRRSAGDAFREMLSLAGELWEENSQPPPPPSVPLQTPPARDVVESLKQKLRSKYGITTSSIPSTASSVAGSLREDRGTENDFSQHNSRDEFDMAPRPRSRSRWSSEGSVASSPPVKAEAQLPVNRYDDSGLREIEAKRQHILSRLLSVGQGQRPVSHVSSSRLSDEQKQQQSESPSPLKGGASPSVALSPQSAQHLSESARQYLQKLVGSGRSSEGKVSADREGDASPKMAMPNPSGEGDSSAAYNDVTNAIELLKQRKRDSLRLIR